MPTVCCYDQTIVDCVDEEEEEEKTDRTRCCNSWHHTQRRSGRDMQAKQEKKKGSVYVIEDTARRREREREGERKGKKNMNGIRCLRRWKRFDYDEFSILPFCSVSFSFPFP
jgi:hypothetical protein